MVVPIGTLLRQEFVIVNDLVLVIGFVHVRLVKQGCGSSLSEFLENCEVESVKESKNGVIWQIVRKVWVFIYRCSIREFEIFLNSLFYSFFFGGDKQ